MSPKGTLKEPTWTFDPKETLNDTLHETVKKP